MRNDTGVWNTEPETYPDGIYWGIDDRGERGNWNVDVWFVTDAERQPDLQHLRTIAPQLTDETREAILTIKRAWWERPEYRRSVTSIGIYRAVLEQGVRTSEQFQQALDGAANTHRDVPETWRTPA